MSEHQNVPDGWEVVSGAAPAASTPSQAERPTTGRPVGHSALSDAPDSGISQWFEQHLRPAMEAAAHPQTLEDLASVLLAPTDTTRGAGMAILEKALGTLKSAGKSTTAAAVKGAAALGDMVDPDVVGVISPRAGKALSLAQRLRAQMATKAAPAAAQAAVPAASPAAGPVPASTPVAAPVAAPAASAPISLTNEEWRAMRDLVSQGHSQADVLKAIANERASAAPGVQPEAPAPDVLRRLSPATEATVAPAAEAAPVAAPAKLKFSAAEVKEYQRLTKAGKSPAEAQSLIEAQRLFQQRHNLPTSEAARGAVVDRNASGRWSE